MQNFLPKKIFHLILGVLFLPICFSASLVLRDELNRIKVMPQAPVYFFAGCIVYLVVHAAVIKPERLYVFGHEMMHAIAALISGAKVTSFRVSDQGGKITATKSNLFISLAPYIFPFYTAVVVLLYFVISYFKPALNILPAFLFCAGFCFSFHVILTVDFLKIRQPDLQGAGYLFSISSIYLVNLVLLMFILSLVFDEITFGEILKHALFKSKHAYANLFRQLFVVG